MRTNFLNKERRPAGEPSELADFEAAVAAAHQRYLDAAASYWQIAFGSDEASMKRRQASSWPAEEPTLQAAVDVAHERATAARVRLNAFMAAKAAERLAAGGVGPFERARLASERDRRRRLAERLQELGVAVPGEGV